MDKMNWTRMIALAMVLTVAAVGCAKKEDAAMSDPAPARAETQVAPVEAVAHAKMMHKDDMGEAGMVMFSAQGDSVKIVAHIIGAPPGTHGLHIHEVGDCSSADFKSAGGHFNPTDSVHGGPEDAERHAGDLGNIEIGADGSGHLELESDLISLGNGDNSVIGRGVILHEKMDDLVSQPTGAAGSRLACGVVAPKVGV